jgi:hypothetical protein
MSQGNSSSDPLRAASQNGERAPVFVDEVDEFTEFIDHDTRGEPGYVPPRDPPLIPRLFMPIDPPDSPRQP